MKRLLLVMMCCAVAAWAGSQDVVNSPHNLSASGTGAVKSTQSDVCVFCHAPHNVRPDITPLWNHQLSTQVYTPYSSTTMAAAPLQPSPSSKLCLSCHDGTVALGQTIASGTIVTTGALPASANFGTDLRNDHPVGITPVNNGELAVSLFQSPPATLDSSVKLQQGKVECTTCHDPHKVNNDTVARSFLVRSNATGALCLACHDPSRGQPNQLNGWMTGAHKTATNSVPVTAQAGEYGTVGANACVSCHLPHNAPSTAPARLLRGVEEATCASCHSGTNLSPAIANVMGEFNKTYVHPTTRLSGLHDAAESAFPLNANRHAECADCHNTHAASNTGGSTTPPALQAALLGASGVDSATGASALRPAGREYEICFKCHANSTNKPQSTSGYSAYGRTPVRQTFASVADPYNTRLEFNTNLSRHPVTQPRYKTNTQVPSLRANMINLDGSAGRSLAAGTYLYCTDCHSNNQARNSRGAGPNGPHGSTWPHLLERRYDIEPAGGAGVSYVAGINGTYALCYKCHNVDGIVANNIGSFPGHNKHVNGERASCATCHASHGIQGGTATNNPSLVNFDTTIVTPSSSNRLQYVSNGSFRGSCYLRCHGKDHNPESY
ncbi:MAG: cytochrome c3 family protein [Terriglobales bacterium]